MRSYHHHHQHPKVGVAAMMLRSPPPPRLKVLDLNPHLSCILCGGYFIDATTITECLHSFCRACIVRYLETSEYCPVCEVQVHKTKPLRSDKILQDIVYKLVPGLFHNEMKRRRELYASQPPEALKESRDAEDRGECLDERFIYAPDEIFSLSIEYGKEADNKDSSSEEDSAPKRRFLRCPAAVTISHLKKFIRMKYGIPNSYEVDLRYDKESVLDDYTLMDVAYIFLWKRKGPLRFFFRIVEKPPRKAKSQHIFMNDYVDAELSTKEVKKETKDSMERTETTEDIRPPPVQSVVPQSQPTCSTEKYTTISVERPTSCRTPPAVESTTAVVESTSAIVESTSPVVESTTPVVESITPMVESTTSVVESTTSVVESTTPIVESTTPIIEPADIEQKEIDLPVKISIPMNIAVPEEKMDTSEKSKEKEKKETKKEESRCMSEQSAPIDQKQNTTNKTEPKLIPFKLPPISLNKASSSESKPAVMAVAPLMKPSSSFPTSTTPVTGTVTHGLYTGISIKKSPPNTLPPFKISTHLLPPRVPPLKLSPPRFSKLETCLRELSSSKKSSASKKSKSSRGSSDKLELKVAQLKSASIKCVAPLVISVPPEAKLDSRKDIHSTQSINPEKKSEVLNRLHIEEFPRVKKSPLHIKEIPPPPAPLPSSPAPESKNSSDDDKMDLDNDLFEGRLVIAEPDIPPKDDSDNSNSKSATDVPPPKVITKLEDSEDEEIDVVDDVDVDSGRGSDISRTEARSLCGDDDLGSPDSVPKTPEAERQPPVSHHSFPDPKPTAPKTNGIAPPPVKSSITLTNGNDCGVLDLSTCGRKRSHDGDGPVHRAKQVANPAVLDKTRQTTTPCISPNHSPFKVLTPEIPHISLYKSKHESSRGNFKCRGNTLTVINPDPNGNRPKIVIRNLGPRPDRGHERFHHHHHHHNHHHQRM